MVPFVIQCSRDLNRGSYGMSENEVIATLDSGAYGLVGCGGVAGIMLFPVGTHKCQCSNLVRGREGGKRFMSLGLITGALPCSSPTKIIRILHK